MFKKVLQSISKSLQRQGEAPASPPVAKPEAPAPSARAQASASREQPQPKAESALKKIVQPAPAAAAPTLSPEELCGIDGKMNKDQIRDRLKLLYRRHNRAASSLDAKTRSEADIMLDAIVAIREKTFGAI